MFRADQREKMRFEPRLKSNHNSAATQLPFLVRIP